MLLDAETRYSMIEKAVFAIIVAARKLRPYFDAHPVVVLTDLPLEKSIEKIERSGRLAKWAVELNGLGIQFQSRKAIKGQALAAIFVEWETQDKIEEPIWQLLTDGSSRLVGAGAGLVLISPEGKIIEYALKFQFKATNNEAEYEAVIARLQLCKALEARKVNLKTDSQLVVNQIKGEYEARDVIMQKYLKKAQELISWFEVVHIERLPRSQNEQADALSKLGSFSMQNLKRSVLVEVKPVSSIHEDDTSIFNIEDRNLPDWMKNLIQYKKNGELPADPVLARRMKMKSLQFCMVDG